ncbi:hypothetical protein P691DRAFT_228242 [Macrolepiota fuliginosa MF-IS2]|uniref:Uncharacterized protein n=1 Tax=Macrolepiota fuliginosa MF-IS2 TaxID=1400762 RepID=A0A9P5X9C3_9AGAR|nr:hypothetical protein P691DRAFT_228242 [Macrolepiota fuliginosa MF-IS2]
MELFWEGRLLRCSRAKLSKSCLMVLPMLKITTKTTNLPDTTTTQNIFFTCQAAGPASCAFWASSPALISVNLIRIYKDPIGNPIPVHTPTLYGAFDYFRSRTTIFNSLCSP